MDSVTKSVLDKYLDRAVAGKNKYGTDMDRNDLNVVQWLQHLQEEMMDATLTLKNYYKNRRSMSEFTKSINDEGMEMMNRMWQLFQPLNNMWQRVLKDPSKKENYFWTDEELLTIKHTAEAFVSGDKSGK